MEPMIRSALRLASFFFIVLRPLSPGPKQFPQREAGLVRLLLLGHQLVMQQLGQGLRLQMALQHPADSHGDRSRLL